MDKTAYFEQMRQKRRNDILDAAKRMILTHGIDDFNIQQLTRELDISTVTLYKYFKNSEDIILALQEQIAAAQQFSPVEYSSDDNPLDLFLDFHRAFFRDVLKHRENVTLLVLFEVYLRGKPQYKQSGQLFSPYSSQIYDFLSTLLEDAKIKGLISSSVQVKETFDFISSLNTAFIRQIGLMEDENFSQQEAAVSQQISTLLEFITIYLLHPHETAGVSHIGLPPIKRKEPDFSEG